MANDILKIMYFLVEGSDHFLFFINFLLKFILMSHCYHFKTENQNQSPVLKRVYFSNFILFPNFCFFLSFQLLKNHLKYCLLITNLLVLSSNLCWLFRVLLRILHLFSVFQDVLLALFLHPQALLVFSQLLLAIFHPASFLIYSLTFQEFL